MTDLARRSIEELLVRYELEPTLDDVFVEGDFDKEVLNAAFLGSGLPEPAIYDIDSVEVPMSLLSSYGLSVGNKQRVIALSRELSKLQGEISQLCLVDKDLDHWFGDLESNKAIRWTTHASIDMHFFSEKHLRDILLVACKARIDDFPTFLISLRTVLLDLYALRLADRELEWKLRWHSPSSCLSKNGSSVLFDLNIFSDRVLQANNKFKRKAEFERSLTNWKSKLVIDCRQCIRGHDFVDVLVWASKSFRGVREICSETAVGRLLIVLARGDANIREELLRTQNVQTITRLAT